MSAAPEHRRVRLFVASDNAGGLAFWKRCDW
jgi:hypothetical protein